jgi:tetratricopeptide (TPR) repeat protein
MSTAARATVVALVLTMVSVTVACSDGDDARTDTSVGVAADTDALIQRGLEAFERGDLAAAEDAFGSAVEREPDNTVALFNLGATLVARGEGPRAVTVLDELLLLEPGNVDGRYNRGVAKANAGDTAGAALDYAGVIDADPEHARARFQLGNILIAEGQLDEGMDLVDQAIALDPSLAGDDVTGD